MPTVLITGAARGLGLEFVRQYREAGWDVIATARTAGGELRETGAQVESLDVSDFDALIAFGQSLDRPLDLLIANAGTYGPQNAESAEDGKKWLEAMAVNSVAPVLLARTLMPRLVEAGGKAIALSSKMGSIADSSTGSIPYRASKAALNMAWHVLANEARSKGVTMATVHPGWVQTDMGGANAPLAASESIAGLRQVIEQLSPAQSGGFFNYDGTEIPW